MAMTWKELADFINNEMPECNRDQVVRIWDAGESGKFFNACGISAYDEDEGASEANIFTIDTDMDEDYCPGYEMDAIRHFVQPEER